MLSVKLVCTRCGREFSFNPAEFNILGLQNIPQKCPACVDAIQKRPEIVLDRRVKEYFGPVEIETLPDEWAEYRASEGDRHIYRIDVKGKKFGASWYGRIIIFAPAPFAPGDIVVVNVMEVKKLIKEIEKKRKTMEHGEVTYFRRVPIDSPEGQTKEIVDQYIRFDPYKGDEKPIGKLVWRTARTKTTLKGLGRQYFAGFETEACIWSKAIRGGFRSGRAYTDGVLAIVNEKHPLVYWFKENGEHREMIY